MISYELIIHITKVWKRWFYFLAIGRILHGKQCKAAFVYWWASWQGYTKLDDFFVFNCTLSQVIEFFGNGHTCKARNCQRYFAPLVNWRLLQKGICSWGSLFPPFRSDHFWKGLVHRKATRKSHIFSSYLKQAQKIDKHIYPLKWFKENQARRVNNAVDITLFTFNTFSMLLRIICLESNLVSSGSCKPLFSLW